MPFREKKAWFTIGALLMVFVPYYVLMVRGYHQADPDFHYLADLALHALGAFVLLQLGLIAVARKLSPEDAGIERDEREQLFAYRAGRVAYIILILMMLLITFVMIHLEGGNWGWGMAYFGAILVAEIARAIALIVQYRRDY